jgi:uncharacterized membrane protein HdeD (DUF308 family)
MTTIRAGDPSPTFAPGMRPSDAVSAVLARNWWAFAIRGLVGVVVGVIALVMPAATMLALVLLFAAYMLVDGVFAIIAAVRAGRQHDRWGILALEGVADLVAGAIAILWPGITVVAFVLLIAAWAIVSGGLVLAVAFRLNIEHGRWWLVLGGAASVIYGALLIVAPLIGALVLTWWFGAYALVFGVALLILAFRLRARHHSRLHPAVARGAT